MRLFSEELRNGSFTLLLSAPVSLPQILFGKLLGLAGMLAALAVLPLLLCLSLLPWSALDLGMLMAAELGLLLVLISFAAIGLFFSTLTSQPQAAAAGAYGALLLLSVINQVSAFDHSGAPLLGWLAWNEHFLPFLLGLVRTSDLAYFLLFLGAAVTLLAVFAGFTLMPDKDLKVMRPTGLDPGSLRYVRIDRGGDGDVLEFKRRPTGWRMTMPYSRAADTGKLHAVARIAAAPSRRRFTAADIDPAELGLSPPSIRLNLDAELLEIGAQNRSGVGAMCEWETGFT